MEAEQIIKKLNEAPRNRRRPIRVTFMVTDVELGMLRKASDNALYEGDISKLIRTILHEKLDPL